MKKILVTGGDGFIGKHLIERLHETPYIFDLKRGDDITKELELDRKGIPMDYVIHLAAIHDVQYANNHPKETLETNVYGTWNLLREAKKKNCKKFVFVSSAATYEKSLSPYGLSKTIGEMMVRNSGLDYVILRLFNVYGPRQEIALFGNLMKCLNGTTYSMSEWKDRKAQSGYAGIPIRINGDGTNTRDFIYIDDVCDAIIKAIDLEHITIGVFDIGTGISTSVNEAVDLFQKEFGKIPIIYLDAVNELKTSKAKLNELFYIPKISLEKGLKRMHEWKKNQTI